MLIGWFSWRNRETVAGVPEASLSVTRTTPLPCASQTAAAVKSPMLHASAVWAAPTARTAEAARVPMTRAAEAARDERDTLVLEFGQEATGQAPGTPDDDTAARTPEPLEVLRQRHIAADQGGLNNRQ